MMDVTLQAAWLTVIATLVAALLGVAGTLAVQHWLTLRRERAAARVEVYFDLMALDGHYFWVAAAEARGEKPKREQLDACFGPAWRIADQLRKNDSLEHLEEILEVLFNHTIPTAKERANRLGSLIDKYGRLVNPAYARSIRRISDENIMALGSGKPIASYPPGASHHTIV